MDDLLVIILTLIIAGVGALGQIKKKKEMQQPAAPQPQPQPDEDIWEFIQSKHEEQGQRVPATQTYEEPVMPESVLDNYTKPEAYQFVAEQEGASSIKDRMEPVITQKRVRKNKVDFSLKKAVIYSEILNRKYV